MNWPWNAPKPPFEPMHSEGIPDPVDEQPPADEYCDLVLNGGVASGVVYPWALVGLARRYRFRNIGGNSVGAIAAAIAAAAEYGRCNGVSRSFEALRRIPMDLAEEDNSHRARMLRLFQPLPSLDRLFSLFVQAVSRHEEPRPPSEEFRPDMSSTWHWLLKAVMRIYGLKLPLIAALVGSVVWAIYLHVRLGWSCAQSASAGVALVALSVAAIVALGYVRILGDLKELGDNDYGLCPGRSQDGRTEALVEWLHRGIQLSAGRGEGDAPLTFADLWSAPRGGQRGPSPGPNGMPPDNPGIRLCVFTSNVTQGRAVRLPLDDDAYRLYYRREEWARIFPDHIMRALDGIAESYVPQSASDPAASTLVRTGPVVKGKYEMVPASDLREVPRANMPLVVAARLSLCFPLLFALIPVYAVDYESPRDERNLRRCLLADGGLCSNFPVHLFDRAQPTWPTFAILLERRLQDFEKESVWLPSTHLSGRGDNWQRFVAGAEKLDPHTGDYPKRAVGTRLIGLVLGMVLTMKDWNDRMAARLPTVRSRVLRIGLQEGEGQLHISMSGKTIMKMANEYGNGAARCLLEAFAPQGDGSAGRGWQEHRYVRAITELRALHRHLDGYSRSVSTRTGGSNLVELLDIATKTRPLAAAIGSPVGDTAGGKLQPSERDALDRAINAIAALERELGVSEPNFGPYVPAPVPELRLRTPV